ncbi:CU044_2847 family protein [Streptomyces olivaceus]|uniref:CU044_2847 family protein n=1 Tax=Streptomyces olivaceus TaxID=47716 RepID=UPI001CC96084|nr:CU044_2847 family protein [Streptomyces olivaceus]MBZ6285589.1 hypothetical protein [Streptomyces olivaceus]
MGQEVTRVARVVLPDGTPVWARISGAAELPAPRGQLSFSDTGFAERVEAGVESLHSLVTGVARSLAEPLRAVRPDEVSVQFGIELTAKAGKVVGLLADGETKAGITVTLTWNGGPPDPNASDPSPSDPSPSDADESSGPNSPAPGGPEPGGAGPDAAGPGAAGGGGPSEPRAGASARAPGHGGTGGAGSGGAV